MRVHLAVWGFIPSHSFALLGAWNVTLRLAPWPAPLQALALVTSPRLRLRHISFGNFLIMLCMSYSQRKVTLVRFLLVCRSSYTFYDVVPFTWEIVSPNHKLSNIKSFKPMETCAVNTTLSPWRMFPWKKPLVALMCFFLNNISLKL